MRRTPGWGSDHIGPSSSPTGTLGSGIGKNTTNPGGTSSHTAQVSVKATPNLIAEMIDDVVLLLRGYDFNRALERTLRSLESLTGEKRSAATVLHWYQHSPERKERRGTSGDPSGLGHAHGRGALHRESSTERIAVGSTGGSDASTTTYGRSFERVSRLPIPENEEIVTDDHLQSLAVVFVEHIIQYIRMESMYWTGRFCARKRSVRKLQTMALYSMLTTWLIETKRSGESMNNALRMLPLIDPAKITELVPEDEQILEQTRLVQTLKDNLDGLRLAGELRRRLVSMYDTMAGSTSSRIAKDLGHQLDQILAGLVAGIRSREQARVPPMTVSLEALSQHFRESSHSSVDPIIESILREMKVSAESLKALHFLAVLDFFSATECITKATSLLMGWIHDFHVNAVALSPIGSYPPGRPHLPGQSHTPSPESSPPKVWTISRAMVNYLNEVMRSPTKRVKGRSIGVGGSSVKPSTATNPAKNSGKGAAGGNNDSGGPAGGSPPRKTRSLSDLLVKNSTTNDIRMAFERAAYPFTSAGLGWQFRDGAGAAAAAATGSKGSSSGAGGVVDLPQLLSKGQQSTWQAILSPDLALLCNLWNFVACVIAKHWLYFESVIARYDHHNLEESEVLNATATEHSQPQARYATILRHLAHRTDAQCVALLFQSEAVPSYTGMQYSFSGSHDPNEGDGSSGNAGGNVMSGIRSYPIIFSHPKDAMQPYMPSAVSLIVDEQESLLRGEICYMWDRSVRQTGATFFFAMVDPHIIMFAIYRHRRTQSDTFVNTAFCLLAEQMICINVVGGRAS
eukprot:Clim_evm39s210 gene=Clim_evmTU39s210